MKNKLWLLMVPALVFANAAAAEDDFYDDNGS